MKVKVADYVQVDIGLSVREEREYEKEGAFLVNLQAIPAVASGIVVATAGRFYVVSFSGGQVEKVHESRILSIDQSAGKNRLAEPVRRG